MVGGFNRLGEAKAAGIVQLVLGQVHANDPRSAAERRALDHVDPHTTAAIDGDRRAWPDARGVYRRADAGHHCAAQQGGLGEGHLGADGDDGRLGHDGIFG